MSAKPIAEDPPALRTVTSTMPVTLGGVTAFNVEPETIVNEDAARVPKMTAVVVGKRLRVIVTVFPPMRGPLAGVIADTIGGARYVN